MARHTHAGTDSPPGHGRRTSSPPGFTWAKHSTDPTRKIKSFTRSDTLMRNSPKSSVSSGTPSWQTRKVGRSGVTAGKGNLGLGLPTSRARQAVYSQITLEPCSPVLCTNSEPCSLLLCTQLEVKGIVGTGRQKSGHQDAGQRYFLPSCSCIKRPCALPVANSPNKCKIPTVSEPGK